MSSSRRWLTSCGRSGLVLLVTLNSGGCASVLRHRRRRAAAGAEDLDVQGRDDPDRVQHGDFGSVLRFWRRDCWQPAAGERDASCYGQAEVEEVPE
jgi:hypothetical protein